MSSDKDEYVFEELLLHKGVFSYNGKWVECRRCGKILYSTPTRWLANEDGGETCSGSVLNREEETED